MDIMRINKIFSLIVILLVTHIFINVSGSFAKDSKTAESKNHRVLTIYNWQDYIGEETLQNFQEETGIEVKEVYFEDEEEIIGAILSNPSAFDLVMTSGDHLRAMREGKMLAKIDFSKVENIRHISAEFKNRYYDPQQEYSVPYMTGTTGVVINTKYIPEDTASWSVLYDEKYKGRIAMLNNLYEVMATAAILQGFSINTTDNTELNSIAEMLKKQRPLVHDYRGPDVLIELMESETIWAAHQYSGEGITLMDRDEKFVYFVPEEGAPTWIDSFAIPRRSKMKDEAHIFLNYILRPEVNATIANYLWNATPNKAAEKFLNKELLESEEVYPPAEVKARLEYFIDIGGADADYNRIWRDLRMGN